MSTVLVSHGHLDHVGAVGYWASQRYLNSLGHGSVIAPSEIADEIRRLLETFATLEGGRSYDVEVLPVESGDSHRLRADMDLKFFATDHWVPTLGCRLVWRTQHLRAELRGLPGDEIARRRQSGIRISEERRIDLVAYCADGGPGLFAAQPAVLGAEVVVLECSFYHPRDRDRATRYGHMHLDDLVAVAGRLSCRHLVLLHASRRQRLREVEQFLDDELRPQLGCELHHLMVDWD